MKNKPQSTTHDASCSLYDSAENCIRIKDGSSEHPFNKSQLNELKQMQQMIDRDYESQLVNLRRGCKVMWGTRGSHTNKQLASILKTFKQLDRLAQHI